MQALPVSAEARDTGQGFLMVLPTAGLGVSKLFSLSEPQVVAIASSTRPCSRTRETGPVFFGHMSGPSTKDSATFN